MPNLRGITRQIKTVQDAIPISVVLEQMIQDKIHITLVANKDQKVVGMVALEDIIEEMVGEIEDEFDRLPNHIHPYGGGWIMGGGVFMHVLAQTTGVPWNPETPADAQLRLSDWFSRKCPMTFKGGEVVESDGISVMVRKLCRKKIGEAIVSVNRTQSERFY